MITENLSTLKIHKLTQAQYERELAAGNIDESALYLTPEEEVDLSGYATVEQVNAKQNSITGGASTITTNNLTSSRALVSNGSGKVSVSATTSTELGQLSGIKSNVQTQLDGKASTSHTHDDRYYTESEIDTKLSGKANSSHGNHVPSTQTADNSKFLRNDNTWATVTPANIGAAASSHNHSASNITSGTIATDRLPVIPVSKGGTGATTIAAAQSNLGIVTLDEIPNLYIWKKYESNPSTPKETSVSYAQIAYSITTVGSAFTMNYSDEIVIEDNTLVLVNPTSLTLMPSTVTTDDLDIIKGKYVEGGSITSKGYFRIPIDATFTITQSAIKVVSAQKLSIYKLSQYTASKASDAYPINGEHTDGYWYVYHKQLGD